MTRDLTAEGQEVNNLDSYAVVQELELAMNLALYGLLGSLGTQYIVGSLSWRSLSYVLKSLVFHKSVKFHRLFTVHCHSGGSARTFTPAPPVYSRQVTTYEFSMITAGRHISVSLLNRNGILV